MSTEVLRPCLDCGKPAQGRRCQLHRRTQQDAANRPASANPAYDGAWRKVVRQVVSSHVLAHGWNCPGYGRNPHPSTDLTGDHVVSLADGGASVAANVRILCRSCNSRKGKRSGTIPDTRPITLPPTPGGALRRPRPTQLLYPESLPRAQQASRFVFRGWAR